jgi:hypothetical protein
MLVVERAVEVATEVLVFASVFGGDFVGEAEVEVSEGLLGNEVELGESERHWNCPSSRTVFIAIGCSL